MVMFFGGSGLVYKRVSESDMRGPLFTEVRTCHKKEEGGIGEFLLYHLYTKNPT